MGTGKSPGSDGLTSEFYKCFWDEVGDDNMQSINNAFDKGELSICQKRGIITLLPKKDKPTDVLIVSFETSISFYQFPMKLPTDLLSFIIPAKYVISKSKPS